MEKLISGIGIVALGGIGWVFNGLVFCDFWEWFLVPLGAHPITIIHGMGICMFRFWTARIKWDRDHETPTAAQALHAMGSQALAVLMLWGVGYVLSGYI
jgi:hypothetical protein